MRLVIDQNRRGYYFPSGQMIEDLRRAHSQLTDFISRAAKLAELKNLPLYEMEIVTDHILNKEGWVNYVGETPFSPTFNWSRLTDWFNDKYGEKVVIEVDASKDRGRWKRRDQMVILFFKRTQVQPNHCLRF